MQRWLPFLYVDNDKRRAKVKYQKYKVIKECIDTLMKSEYRNYEIGAIYAKEENESISVFAIAYSKESLDEGATIYGMLGSLSMKFTPEWAYSIDEDDFDFIEQGGEILYMHPEHHYNIWCAIEEIQPQNMINQEGMFQYVDYCKQNKVSKKFIEIIVELPLDHDVLKDVEKYRVETKGVKKEDKPKQKLEER